MVNASMDKAISFIGKYIKDHLDDNRPMPVEMVRNYALLGKIKADREKEKKFNIGFNKILKDLDTDNIHNNQLDSLEKIFQNQSKFDEIADSLSLKTNEINKNLSATKEDLERNIESAISSLEKEYKELRDRSERLTERQIQAINDGDRELSEKLLGITPEFTEKINEINKNLETVRDDLRETISTATKKPDLPETEQILIEETGQIFEIKR